MLPPARRTASAREERCVWCHERGTSLKHITVAQPLAPQEKTVAVHPEHEASVRAYAKRLREHWSRFLALMLGVPVLAVAAMPFLVLFAREPAQRDIFGSLLVLLALTVVGGALVAFPFCTATTVRMIGLRASIRLARGLGIACIVLGLLIPVLTFLT